MFVRVLTVAFWAMVVLAVGWVGIPWWDNGLASGLFGEKVRGS